MALMPLLSLLTRCHEAAVFAPCHSTITAGRHGYAFRNHIWKRFGLPVTISDRGPQFTAAFTHDLCSLFDIDQALSMAITPI